MPQSPVDLGRKIKDILRHTRPLPDEAKSPILHYRRTVTDVVGTLTYIEGAFGQGNRYQAVVSRHLGRLYGMVLVNLVEAFERFLKEAAEFIADDRFDAFKVQGSGLAAHFGAGTLGKSLCESGTWLDCKEINDRFRGLLSDPFQMRDFYLFPKRGQEV